MRCLTLANELKKQGAKIYFVSRHLPTHLNEMLVTKGMGHVSVSSDSAQEPNDELGHSNWSGISQFKGC
jgi:UDP-2,4-diacetamido-2,4,6-trideoxy-beta-L-altropyranose hydrolase